MEFSKRLGFYRAYNVQKVLPAVYDDSLSYYELLCKIQCKLEEVIAFANQLAEYQDVQDQALKDAVDALKALFEDKLNRAVSQLIELINALEGSSLDWDVQHGKYTDTIHAMRDMFNDVTVHSYNVEQIEEIFDDLDMTVDDLANCGLNVKGYALLNHLLLKPDRLTPDMVPTNPTEKGRYTVQDLINSGIDIDGYVYVND